MHDHLQRGHLERLAQRVGVAHAVARVREHPDGRCGNLDPVEAGGLEPLQRGGGGPPFVRDVQPEALLQSSNRAPGTDGVNPGARVALIRHPKQYRHAQIAES